MAILSVYAGTAKDYNTSAAAAYTWKDNTIKHAMVFTTGSAYTINAARLFPRITGTLTGVLTLRIYAGDPTGAQTTLVTSDIDVNECSPDAMEARVWNLLSSALGNATIYTLEMSTNCVLDNSNYISLGGVATGGAAGNQRWVYSSGSWAAQGASRLGFSTYDASDGGVFVVRVDGATSAVFAAAGPKGAAIAATDNLNITMGATLTVDSNDSLTQCLFGDTPQSGTTRTGTANTGYRYGIMTVSAGVTTSWDGAADPANSGPTMNPTDADTSSKLCRLNFNGTSGSPIIWTNVGDAFSATKRWRSRNYYGSVTGQYFTMRRCTAGMAATAGSVWDALAANTTESCPTVSYATFATDCVGAMGHIGFSATPDLELRFIGCTFAGGAAGADYTNTAFYLGSVAAATFKIYCPNTVLGISDAGDICGFVNCTTADTVYVTDSYISIADIRFSYPVPTDFTLTDTGTGGTLKATVAAATIAALADNDMLVFVDTDAKEVGRITKAAYVAELYNKAANSALITGKTNDVPVTDHFCKTTRDGVLFSAAGTAAPPATPTAPAVGADICELYTENADSELTGAFVVGDTLYVDCWLQFNGALADAKVSVKLYEVEAGLIATLLNEKVFSFASGTDYDLVDINTSLPSRAWTGADALSDNYFVELTVEHASLEEGKVQSYSTVGLVAASALPITTFRAETIDGADYVATSVQAGEIIRFNGGFDTDLRTTGHLLISVTLDTVKTVLVDKDFTFAASQNFDTIAGDDIEIATEKVSNDPEKNYFEYTISAAGYSDVTGIRPFAVTDFPVETDVLETAPLYQFGTRLGLAVEEAHSDSDVRFGVGSGTCKVPVKGDVRTGVAVDVSDAGDLSNMTASDPAYVALENGRNNTNGTVAADIIAPATVKIRNATITGTGASGVLPPDACGLTVTISGTTAAFLLDDVDSDTTTVKVNYRLAGQRDWILGATITLPTLTGSKTGLTKSKLYEFQAVPYINVTPGEGSNLERKWVADTSKFKAILDRVEAEIEALAWTGWATSQVTVAWSPALVKDKAMPRLAVAPGNAPDSIVAQTNTSYSVAFPVRLYLMDRVSTRDAQMETLLAKREALRQLFMQRNVLSEVDGVFNVRVEPMPVVNDPDIDERLLITGVELAVEVEEAR